jgi:hypothetical protein
MIPFSAALCNVIHAHYKYSRRKATTLFTSPLTGFQLNKSGYVFTEMLLLRISYTAPVICSGILSAANISKNLYINFIKVCFQVNKHCVTFNIECCEQNFEEEKFITT